MKRAEVLKEVRLFDHGYVRLLLFWGSDEHVIESARVSTQKGFLGWGPKHSADCNVINQHIGDVSPCCCPYNTPGDEKLLKHLWDNQHSSPFEFSGMEVEVKAPIMVFREWHRHRTQSYSEMSARYVPLPDENYTPTLDRVLMSNVATANKQAQGSGKHLEPKDALKWLAELADAYEHCERVYKKGIAIGVAKELARLPCPVARYSAMRAQTDLLNWTKFLKLRCDAHAQWEIRQCADAVAGFMKHLFPRTYEVAHDSLRLP